MDELLALNAPTTSCTWISGLGVRRSICLSYGGDFVLCLIIRIYWRILAAVPHDVIFHTNSIQFWPNLVIPEIAPPYK